MEKIKKTWHNQKEQNNFPVTNHKELEIYELPWNSDVIVLKKLGEL